MLKSITTAILIIATVFITAANYYSEQMKEEQKSISTDLVIEILSKYETVDSIPPGSYDIYEIDSDLFYVSESGAVYRLPCESESALREVRNY